MIIVRSLDRSDLDAVTADIPARAPEMYRRRFEQQERGDGVWLVAWLEGRAAARQVGLQVLKNFLNAV